MKILLCSYSFAPSIGGLESVSLILAREFFKLGHDVIVITHTKELGEPEHFYVIRNPSPRELRRYTSRADIIFQNNISLNLIRPALLSLKPIFITYQTWLVQHNVTNESSWQDKLKRLVMRRCHNIAISNAIANSLPVKSALLYNPYDAELFLAHRDTPKSKDLVYMGRLIEDKGVDILLRAMGLLKAKGLYPNLTVIGGDVHLTRLERVVQEEGLESQVTFAGALTDTRAAEVAKHKIMVVPSRWREPFGIVALEGIAAGCAVIASSGGGLPEAVGPCGLLFPNEDHKALAKGIEALLTDDALRQSFVDKGPEHLKQFEPQLVAKRYLKLFRQAI